jgi:hypothetical protein
MKNEKTISGKLVITGRLNNSRNGNPRYKGYIETMEKAFQVAWINKIDFITAVDSMLSYQITNFDNKLVNAVIGTHYGKPTIKSVEKREL